MSDVGAILGIFLGMISAPFVLFIFAPGIFGHHVGKFLRGVDKGRQP